MSQNIHLRGGERHLTHAFPGPRGSCGMDGGEAGAPDRQRVIRADGEVVELGSVDGTEVRPGDRLVLETPGGGGWGATGR